MRCLRFVATCRASTRPSCSNIQRIYVDSNTCAWHKTSAQTRGFLHSRRAHSTEQTVSVNCGAGSRNTKSLPIIRRTATKTPFGQMVVVKKSPNDKRSYKRLVLKNGLHVILIHDPEIPTQSTKESEPTEKEEGSVDSDEDEETTKAAAACLSVGVGSFADPPFLQGLAHYLEHMLFMGSEKFPNENDYDDYLQQNGGESNAFTDLDNTTYFFKVNGAALHGALDRFAQFFVAPLCLEGSMDREVLAVDSEFSLALQDDYWRLLGLMMSSAKKESLYHRFSSGNKKSLKDQPQENGIPIRDELLKFYKAHYSAERMRLCVLGGESLDDLESWVRELFSDVSSGLGAPEAHVNGVLPFQGQYFYFVSSVKQLNELTVSFQLPSLLTEYKKKSDHYISHLIGHEGPGSLLSELKKRGWAVEISAGIDDSSFNSNTCLSIFEVCITLTESGLNATPGYGLAPVMLLFKYIEMLKETGPEKWIYDEMKTVNDTNVQFLEECKSSKYVLDICQAMLRVEPGDELLATYLYDEWDPSRVNALLSAMHPLADGLRIDLQTKSFDALKARLQSDPTTKQSLFTSIEEVWEEWFEFHYMKCELHKNFLNSIASADSSTNLHLPPENPYIPQDFTIQQSGAETTSKTPFIKPDLLVDENGLRLWHKVDTLHKTPKTFVTFQLTGRHLSDSCQQLWQSTPRLAAAHRLLIAIMEDVLAEEIYMAKMGGLHCQLACNLESIQLTFTGFSEKLPVLVQTVFTRFACPTISDQVFQNMKEELIRKCANQNTKVAKHAAYTCVYSLTPVAWHIDEIIAELHSLELTDVKGQLDMVLKNVFVEALVYGNILADDAVQMCNNVRATFGSCSIHGSDRQLPRCTKIPVQKQYVQLQSNNQQETNSAIDAYFQFQADELVERVKLDFIEQTCDEPCFNILRTQEQLGYIVYSQARLSHGILGFSITVISERFPPNYLETRIEEFLKTFEQTLKDMPQESFEQHRAALIESKLEKDKNLNETCTRLWEHISTRLYDFDARHKEVQIIKKLSKEDLLEWYAAHLSPLTANRCKLSIGIICPKHEQQPESAEYSPEYVRINDLVAFRSEADQHPRTFTAITR